MIEAKFDFNFDKKWLIYMLYCCLNKAEMIAVYIWAMHKWDWKLIIIIIKYEIILFAFLQV